MLKNILKNRIFLVIITMILSVGTTVCATVLYEANQVSYTPEDSSWDVSTVDAALNDLYEAKNSNSFSAESPRISLRTVGSSKIRNTYRGGGAINCYLNASVSLKADLVSSDTTYYSNGTVYGYSISDSTWVTLSTTEGTYSVSPQTYSALKTSLSGTKNVYDLAWQSSTSQTLSTLVL